MSSHQQDVSSLRPAV